MNKNIKEVTPQELRDLYDMAQSEFNIMCDNIERKTGYLVSGLYSLLGDPNTKCLEVDMKISLLEYPHEPNEMKVREYMKYNPNNVLNKPILAHKHNSWYMIYDGVHRTEASRRLGKKTIKTTIIVPTKDKD